MYCKGVFVKSQKESFLLDSSIYKAKNMTYLLTYKFKQKGVYSNADYRRSSKEGK